MVVAGVAVALVCIVASFVMVGMKRLDSKTLPWLLLVGAVCGFIIANITSIKDLSVKIAGIAEVNASVKALQADVAAVQDNQGALAKVAAENQLLLSRSLAAIPATRSYGPMAENNVNRLAEIAERDPQARARWLGDIRARIH